MPRNRLLMHEKLVEVLGSRHVYYQPPETVKMVYPCIVYEHDYNVAKHADNRPYKNDDVYTVTFITKDPDSSIPDAISQLRTASFERRFVAENLHHYVYRIRYMEE